MFLSGDVLVDKGLYLSRKLSESFMSWRSSEITGGWIHLCVDPWACSHDLYLCLLCFCLTCFLMCVCACASWTYFFVCSCVAACLGLFVYMFALGHPSCLDMSQELVGVIQTYRWQCMECKTCTVCQQPHHEDEMMFCDKCDRGYHTFCVGMDSIPTGEWMAHTECMLGTVVHLPETAPQTLWGRESLKTTFLLQSITCVFCLSLL